MYILKPIRTSKAHSEALRELDRLVALDPKPRTQDYDNLEALTILIEAFERSHPEHRIDDEVDPVEAIKFHLDRLGKSERELASVLGCTRTRTWEILNRRRPLTLAQIRRLHRELGIPAERLIAEYPLLGKRATGAATRRPLVRRAATGSTKQRLHG